MSTLREKLKFGDLKVIAEMAGVERSTADKTLRGTRRNPKVLEAARMLFESREAITQRLKVKGSTAKAKI
jgi:hypothetical protein